MHLELELLRDEFNETETLGKLSINGTYECETLELPWKDNERRVSCIPEGRYRICERYSDRFDNHLHINDVPARNLILIHPGNMHTDILGCILPGEKRGELKGKRAVLLSKRAMGKLMKKALPVLIEGGEVWINIKKKKK
jgi:hypothetical protein